MATPLLPASPVDLFDRACPVGHPIADMDLFNVRRAQKGDSDAFTLLWKKHWQKLYRYFSQKTRRREEAEDLASETLLAAFNNLHAFRGRASQTSPPTSPAAALSSDCSFQTYLYAIAGKKLLHWLRTKQSHRCCGFTEMEGQQDREESLSLEERLGADDDGDPLRTLLRQDHLEEVCSALADVGMRSPEQFKALFFHYCCELPHKEIATLLDTRSATINTRLQEGRRTLTRSTDRVQQKQTQ